jgi:phage-related protein
MAQDEGEPPKIPLVFYRSAAGNEPVRDWLKDLDRDDRLAIGMDLLRVQYRWPVGMPLCRALKGGLWEVRTSLPSKTISRVLICFHDGVLVALHGFIKKTQKTPDEELKLARKRTKEVEDGQ